MDASELSPGFYYLGFFNMDYYVHSLCEYELTITMNSSPPNMFKPISPNPGVGTPPSVTGAAVGGGAS